jgi:hypothetical protein
MKRKQINIPGQPGKTPGQPGKVPGQPGEDPGQPAKDPRRPGEIPGYPGEIPEHTKIISGTYPEYVTFNVYLCGQIIKGSLN